MGFNQNHERKTIWEDPVWRLKLMGGIKQSKSLEIEKHNSTRKRCK